MKIQVPLILASALSLALAPFAAVGVADAADSREPAPALLAGETPIGSIVAWPGPAVPPGWHVCDGSEVPMAGNDPTTDPLYRVLGTLYGTARPGHVRLPDYRGRFLRGEDRARAEEPGYEAVDADRAAKRQFVGTEQGWAVGPHVHVIATGYGGRANNGVSNFQSRDHAKGDMNFRTGGPKSTGGLPNTTVSKESRPVNTAVKWIIKVGRAGN